MLMLYFEIIVIFNLIFSTLFSIRLYFERQPGFLEKLFLNDYFQDPPPDREVNKWVWDSLGDWFSWDRVPKANMPIWLCVGENDSVPLSQARKTKQLIPQATLTELKKCGHIPWIESPDLFYRNLTSFLESKK